MRKVFLALITGVFLLSFVLAGCMESGGISQEQYEGIAQQLEKAKEEIAKLQSEFNDLQAQKQAFEAEIQAAQAKITGLQGQIGELKEQYELIGATPAETAANIVQYYHKTHVYSTYDLFICSDMASEVWNMLKAQGISAIIVVGNKDTAIGDILQSNHAWVLAEVAPGEYLALETTGGHAVPESENALYYHGWYFDSPAELKSNNQLVREYNVRVVIRNQIAAEDREVVEEHNQATSQSTADKLKAVHDKLTDLIEAQEAELVNIKSKIDGLATEL
jgi:outer membrane murein-binding lipoprotein Lpp